MGLNSILGASARNEVLGLLTRKKSFSHEQLLRFEELVGQTLSLALQATRLLHRTYFARKLAYTNSWILRAFRPFMKARTSMKLCSPTTIIT